MTSPTPCVYCGNPLDGTILLPAPHGRSCHNCYAPLTAEQITSGDVATPDFDINTVIPPGSNIEWMPTGCTGVLYWRTGRVRFDLGEQGVLCSSESDPVPRDRILAVYAKQIPTTIEPPPDDDTHPHDNSTLEWQELTRAPSVRIIAALLAVFAVVFVVMRWRGVSSD